MSEKSGASVEDGELEAASGSADLSQDEPQAASRVPARRERQSDEDDDFAEDDSAAARPTGKRARRRAAAEESGDAAERRPAKDSKEGKKAKRASGGRSRNPFAVVVQFFREVIAELSKVIWPQRRQMVSYTVIVIIFVAVVVSFVALLDIGFAKLALWLLG
ncbi:preprotein translocase subunit SecE [Segniliparus rugosus]|uniref:Protein translocase subunit SecE n=1 Tax=Segniliparus rugosus (strain ATCC BAA-974 / DSM 45345 / CCUG 50838 / CIP 108380 / JCM 13579 / CDC 945) TaxID=679197 RepID=E5XU73_SEGRC|nr:preprotein translocase subunit SecE [Segniliparus rugosus]EFV12136.1 preprotein translocase, SecE subunit [Segniliparus rugosus ATCC BAA-974]